MRRTTILTIVMALAVVGFGRGATAPEARGRAAVQADAKRDVTAHGDRPDPQNVSDELKRIYQHIDENFEAHVARLQQWVRIRSVSNTVDGQPGVWESARFIRDVIRDELGCPAQIYAPGITEWGAPGNPVVYGRCDVGAEKTIIDYVQSDAMPAWPENRHLWEAPPFGGQIVEKPPFKRVLIGRAASNQKGKEMAEIGALISAKAVTGRLPVNVIYVGDHDEERMEVGLRQFMFDHTDLFADADAVFGYGGSQTADGRGAIVGQSIGSVVFELQTSGMYPGGGLAQQPMWRHVEMLATMYGDDPDGNEVLIEGLSDDVTPPSPEEEEYLRREAAQAGGDFDDAMARRTRVWVHMTGIWGGNMAPGYGGRITPSVITSKHDIRFPPDVDGEDILQKVRAHLDRHGYEDVTINVIGIVPWSWANADTEIARAVRRMYQQFDVPFVEPPKGNYMGLWTAYGPAYLFTREPLQLPIVRGGLGYGAGAHYGPEFYVIEGDGEKIYGYAGAMKAYVTSLYNYAGLNPEP